MRRRTQRWQNILLLWNWCAKETWRVFFFPECISTWQVFCVITLAKLWSLQWGGGDWTKTLHTQNIVYRFLHPAKWRPYSLAVEETRASYSQTNYSEFNLACTIAFKSHYGTIHDSFSKPNNKSGCTALLRTLRIYIQDGNRPPSDHMYHEVVRL